MRRSASDMQIPLVNDSPVNARMPEDTDHLLERAGQGDDAAASRLLHRSRDRLRRMVQMRMDPRIATRIDPSDVIQEAMIVAVRRLPEYVATRPIPFYPWLRRITWDKLQHLHQQHIDAEKRSVRREQPRWDLPDNSVSQLAKLAGGSFSSPSAAAIREETCQRLRKALAQLNDLDREVLLQRYLEHMSIHEIAAGEDVSEASIRMRHLRALRRLKSLLQQKEQQP